MGALVAFLSAVLSGLGLGSGGLYLLYLVEYQGMPQYAAQGVNLVFFVTATLASSLFSLGRGRLKSRYLLPLLAFGMLGTLLGALLTARIPPEVPRLIVGGMMLLGGSLRLLGVLRAKKEKTGRESP